MRTILITGSGGTGRTTLAAATALKAAGEGTRTLLLSADRTDTLGAALGTRTGAEPTEATPGLTTWRPDATERFREDLTAFQDRATTALDLLGAARLDAEELTPCPARRSWPCCAPCATRRPRTPSTSWSWTFPRPRRPSPCSRSPRSSAAICAACCPRNARPPGP